MVQAILVTLTNVGKLDPKALRRLRKEHAGRQATDSLRDRARA
jgi:hypothetical protein